jgi:hypothetical protein
MINIIYNGTRLYENISEEKSTEILLELAEKCYEGELDFDLIEIEKV